MEAKSKSKKVLSETEKIVLVLVFFCGVAIMLLYYKDGISGNDFWWHVKAGEWICNHGKVPKTDIFSWYGMQQGLAWTAHEWLAEVIFYLVYHIFGEPGIFIMSILMALLVYILIWKHARYDIARNICITAPIFLIIAIIFQMFFYGRPQIFSYLLLCLLFYCLYGFWEKPDGRCIYWIPLLSCLWSNLHGGSSNLPYMLCLIFLAGGLFSFKIGRIVSKRLSGKKRVQLLLVAVLSFLAIGINPAGAKMWIYPYANMKDQFMMQVIAEWQALDIKDLGTLIFFFIPLILFVLIMFTAEGEIQFIDFCILGFFSYLFLRSGRFAILFDLAACFCAVRYVPKWKIKPLKKAEKVLVIMMGIFVMLGCVYAIGNMHTAYKEKTLISKVLPDEMLEVIKKENPKRIFNDYNYGEALIFNDIEVFIDGRADVYAAQNILKEAFSIMNLTLVEELAKEDVCVEDLLEKYQFDGYVTEYGGALYTYLSVQPQRYELIYRDESVSYFSIK